MNGTLGKNNYRLDICIGGSGGKSENDKKMWQMVLDWIYVGAINGKSPENESFVYDFSGVNTAYVQNGDVSLKR